MREKSVNETIKELMESKTITDISPVVVVQMESELEDSEDAGIVIPPVEKLGSFLFESLQVMNRAMVEQYRKDSV